MEKTVIAAALAVASVAAFFPQSSAADSRLNVCVSILPQACFVERIAGERATVSVLVGPGQSPHVYEPTPQQIAQMSTADLYFTVGLPFEQRLIKKIAGIAPRLDCVDTARGISLRAVEGHEAHGHAHGAHDPHIWLAPLLIKAQADRICAAVCDKDPSGAARFRDNLRSFHAALDALDAELRAKLAPFAGREVFVFHPAFGYMTDAYGLRQTPIEIQGKEPGSRSLAAVIERARAQGVTVIFAERQFSPKSAHAVARHIGAEVVMLDPLGRDCLANLRFIADRFVYAFRKGSER